MIIEKAPKRYKDDESDEYWDKFSKKITRYYKKHIQNKEVDDDASSFSESLVGIDTEDVNYEEDVSFKKFKNRRQEIYNVEEQSLIYDDLVSVGSSTEEYGDKNNDFENHSNLKSRGDIIDSDVTQIHKHLRNSKSSGDESSTKVNEKEQSSERENSSDSCDISVNFQDLAGNITKNVSAEDLNAPISPLIQTSVPEEIHQLHESTSNESERPIASSTPREEFNVVETKADVHMVLEQDGSKYADLEEDIQYNDNESKKS